MAGGIIVLRELRAGVGPQHNTIEAHRVFIIQESFRDYSNLIYHDV